MAAPKRAIAAATQSISVVCDNDVLFKKMKEIVTRAGMTDAGKDQGRVAKKYFFIKMLKFGCKGMKIF